MIKTLTSSSPYLTVQSPYPPNIYNAGNMNVGDVRYNTVTQGYEIYNGSSWTMVSQSATVSLSWEADIAIRWAIEKQKEEAALKERMEKNPGLKDAWEKFQIMDILTREEDEQSA